MTMILKRLRHGILEPAFSAQMLHYCSWTENNSFSCKFRHYNPFSYNHDVQNDDCFSQKMELLLDNKIQIACLKIFASQVGQK